MKQVWKVQCRVWGGVTGSRTAMLKDADGNEREFETEEAARLEVVELNSRPRSPHSTAQYLYSAVRVS